MNSRYKLSFLFAFALGGSFGSPLMAGKECLKLEALSLNLAVLRTNKITLKDYIDLVSPNQPDCKFDRVIITGTQLSLSNDEKNVAELRALFAPLKEFLSDTPKIALHINNVFDAPLAGVATRAHAMVNALQIPSFELFGTTGAVFTEPPTSSIVSHLRTYALLTCGPMLVVAIREPNPIFRARASAAFLACAVTNELLKGVAADHIEISTSSFWQRLIGPTIHITPAILDVFLGLRSRVLSTYFASIASYGMLLKPWRSFAEANDKPYGYLLCLKGNQINFQPRFTNEYMHREFNAPQLSDFCKELNN